MSKRSKKINVDGSEITIISTKKQDYISLTDVVREIENGLVLIEKWLRNKNTIEFLGIWEEIYNQNFNSPEFEGIKKPSRIKCTPPRFRTACPVSIAGRGTWFSVCNAKSV